ncbi:hypothetical protein [Sulfurovum sp. NBC37-1]|uniref:hypothetical protein n=1 Tax=Sulfurovum sp. (strain NBC37-1) TaxID=387093 RepID=UPI0001587809|nr:hypothetical protein [Sulfurovum sp. NBC37-1]BAF71657.1 hypothetical protein SUN_0698 [Sulfurovum sp. NBC37-1]
MILGISELQKKISIFRNLTETVEIVDKKTKEVLAIVLPKKEFKTANLTDELGGILKSSLSIEDPMDLETKITSAYDQEMREKYGK